MLRLAQAIDSNPASKKRSPERPLAGLLTASTALTVLLGLSGQALAAAGGPSAARAAAAASGSVPVHVVVHMRPENPPAPPAGYVYMGNGVLPIGPPLHDPRPDAVLVLDSPGVDSIPSAAADDTTGGDDPPAAAAQAASADAAAPAARAQGEVEVRLYGARTLPEVIVAPPGTRVSFRNDDSRVVTLRCRQAPELFGAPIAPGTRVTVTAPRPGEFELRSVEYPHLRATLIVPRGPAARLSWSSLGEIGEARLNVPPGSYLARLFFLHRYVAAQAVTVTPQGAEFVLRAVWPTATLASAAPSR